jgi:hypothetical protein
VHGHPDHHSNSHSYFDLDFDAQSHRESTLKCMPEEISGKTIAEKALTGEARSRFKA